MNLVKEYERLDDLELKGLRIIQNPSWFCFGVDAVLLSSFAVIKHKDKVVDLGTGNGIIPLLVYGKYTPTFITGVEIQQEVAEMADRSIKMNDLADRVKIHCGDIKNAPEELGTNLYDVVVTNPPYKKAQTGIVNDRSNRAISRHELLINLDELVYASGKLLRSGGRFYMIHRPERLQDIILSLTKHKFAPKRMKFVHSRVKEKPVMLLVEAVKGGGDFLKIEEPIYVYDDDGRYSNEILAMYGKEPK